MTQAEGRIPRLEKNQVLHTGHWKQQPVPINLVPGQAESVLSNVSGPKELHRFKGVPVKIPRAYFPQLEKMVLKFTWQKRPRMAKAIWARPKQKSW